MKNLTDIKHRIKSIGETRQITNAMETISVAKMRKAMLNYENNETYFEKIRLTMSEIILGSKNITHKYFTKNTGNRAVFVVIASDKGLAGGYNNAILNFAYEKMQKYSEKTVLCVGQLAKEFFDRNGISVDIEFTHVTLSPTVRDASEIASSVMRLYDSNLVDNVYICYTSLAAGNIMRPVISKLLPLTIEDITEKDKDFITQREYAFKELEYDPSPEEVLSDLFSQYITALVYGGLVQAVASEHYARRNAMSSATKNATEILSQLSIDYNRARQETITNEISEIVTSSMNVK